MSDRFLARSIQAGETRRIRFHKYQWELWRSQARFLAFISGTQAGKTFFGSIWIQNEVEKDIKADYAIIAPTYKIMEQATLPKFFENNVLPGKWKEADKTWVTGSGGNIFIRSAEDPDNIESMTLKAAWLDEAGRMKAKVWPVLQSRLAINRGRLLLTTTWYYNNWLNWQVYKPWQSGDPDFKVVEMGSAENPAFPEQDIEKLRKMCGSEAEFQRRFMGKLAVNEGLVYREFNRVVHVRKLENLPESWTRFAGIDFGYTLKHPTAVVFMALGDDGTIYIEDVYVKSKGLMSEHAFEIKSRLNKHRYTGIWGDSAAAQEIAELQAFNIPVLAATRKFDVKPGIDRINRFLRLGKLVVLDTLENQAIVDEFETYSWDDAESGLNARERVIKDKDDCMDAMRYGIINQIIQAPEPEAKSIISIPRKAIINPVTGYPTGHYEQDNSASFRYRYLHQRGEFLKVRQKWN